MKNFGFVLFCLICVRGASAQTGGSDTTQTNFIQKNFSITGDAGLYGELYGISGGIGRRPPSSARLYFRPTMTLFNSFAMSFDFLLSTEGSSARQNIDQLGINPSWGWGNGHLGDFTDEFTPMTFDGVLVRGAGVNLNPGLFRLSAIGGFTQRAVDGSAGTGSYSRYIYGAKIGVGKQDESYFDVSFLRARDNPSSLGPPQPTITVIAPNGNDSWPVGNIETITWASSGIFGYVRIELSRDGGATYAVLYDSISNSGSQPWVVTGPPSTQAIIKVTSLQDSVSDVSDLRFTIGLGVSEVKGSNPGIPVNTFSVTPEENLVVGADTKIEFFDNVLTLSGEIDGSAFSRDMGASEVDSLKLPSIITGLFRPRVGSQADFAYDGELGLNLSTFTMRADYKYIGPGYVSLGVSSLLPDQREITLATMIRVSGFSMGINAGHQNDNLLSQKSYTTSRNQIGASVNLPLSTIWSASIMSNFTNMFNNAASDTFKIDYSSFMAGMTHTLFFGADNFVQTVTLSYIYQGSGDSDSLRQSSGLISHSLNFSVVMSPEANLNIIPAFSLIDSRIGGLGWTSTQTYSIAAQNRAFESRLTTSLSLGYSVVQGSSSMQISLSSGYTITSADALTLAVMESIYGGTETFNEHTVSLTLSHRF
ncbi:MAG: hypothetical protein WAO19_00655 [Candidatus Kryptoniota bacterium]